MVQLLVLSFLRRSVLLLLECKGEVFKRKSYDEVNCDQP
jgi:hypothetical protein